MAVEQLDHFLRVAHVLANEEAEMTTLHLVELTFVLGGHPAARDQSVDVALLTDLPIKITGVHLVCPLIVICRKYVHWHIDLSNSREIELWRK